MLLPDLEFFDVEKDVIARIKAFPLERLSDIERIKNEVLSGNTVILSIKSILYTSPINLKRITQQIKAFLNVHGGQIVQIGDQFILVTPPTIRFEKEQKTSELMDKKEIAKIRKEGFAMSFAEKVNLCAMVSAPIRRYGGEVIAVLNILWVTDSPDPKTIDKYSNLVKEAAKNASLEMGYFKL